MTEEINLQPAVKTTLNVANFSAKNTPPIIEKIGNWCLIIAFIGGIITLAPISAPAIIIITKWTVFAGLVGKLLSKFSGNVDATGTPTLASKDDSK